jgi:uncharacterized protein (DUF58 family)
MYSSMMMFMGIAAMNTQANLLFGVFGLMIGVLLISGVISRMVLSKLTVRRDLPEAAVVGMPVPIGYAFHNGKRFWPSLSVQVAELDGVEAFRKQPHAYLLHTAGRGTAMIQVEVTPKRRGAYALGQYQTATSFPFGFVKRAVIRHQEDVIVVFPALARVDSRVLRLLRSSETAGVTVRPQRGGEDELYGLKEYRAGENPRLIHWKRSARTGVIVTREMTRVSPPRVMILVDTLLADRSEASHAGVERAIAVAASLASESLEQGLMVGIAAAAPSGAGGDSGGRSAGESAAFAGGSAYSATGPAGAGFVVIAPNRGKRHRRDVLSALARLPMNTRVEVGALREEAMRSARSGTTMVLVSQGASEQNLAEQARGTTVVLSVGSPTVRTWFEFGEDVDFSLCMPADQQPEISAGDVKGARDV